MPVPADTEVTEEQEEEEVLLPNTNIVTHCIYKNDTARLTKCFEDDTDKFKETVPELLNERDDDGKSPLDLASTLGRVDLVRELILRGADVNESTEKGYTSMHHASAWGKIDVLKILVENHCNLQKRNVHGERPRETAVRYNQAECIDYLDWAEAKVNLVETIKMIQESVTDPEKAQGRIAKDEKNLALNSCKEKTDWVENTPEATTQDFIVQKQALDSLMAPILTKLSEPPPEKPEKK